MLKNINLLIKSNGEKISKSQVFYEEFNNAPLESNEVLINFLENYNTNTLNTDAEFLYILFNSKKIKGHFNNKRTIFTIDKANYQQIIDDLSIITNFSIADKIYPINPLENLIPCNLLFGKGGIFEANEIHSAVFFPYFIENPPLGNKYTFIFANLMFERFKQVSSKILIDLDFNVFIDDKKVNLETLSINDVVRWIVLHEYIHNSGPLPLLSYDVNKFSKKTYGYIEELRVDLTTIKVILDSVANGNLQQNYYNVICIIIIERIFRAAIYNYSCTWNKKNGMFSKEVEGDTAISLLITLLNYGIISLKERFISIKSTQFNKLIEAILFDIYKYESIAKEKNQFESTHLAFSAFFRKSHLEFSDEIISFLSKYAVQNCEYSLEFIG